MKTIKIFVIILSFLLCNACNTREKIEVNEEDKIFHAAPAESGLGGMFFGLYKGNKYEFCDGTFMDPGCYTGFYNLSGDTIILYDLKHHDGIPTNKFLICRYNNMDSSYWQWKYPTHKKDWQDMRHDDSASGSTGDVFPLDQNSKIVFDKADYFVIHFDELKNIK